MNYLEIVLQGYLDEIDRKFLKEYFLREFKKAEKENFSPEVFFTGCLNVTEKLEVLIKHEFSDRIDYLQRQINDAKNGWIQYKDLEGKTIEQKRQETIEYCENEISLLSEDDFTIPLRELTNNETWGNLRKEDLVKIKRAINKAFQEAQTNIEQPQQNEKPKPVKYKADEYALAYIFDLYANSKQVPKNRIEGGLNAKHIKEDSALFSSYDKTPDGFYRAVKKVLNYDLNKPFDLQNISKDWYNAVKSLSNNWSLTKQYLKDKDLIKE